MCGIAGLVYLDKNQNVDESVLLPMRDVLAHRGPDGSGIYLHEQCGLVHRRLSVIDLSDRAAQPFISADGRYVIVYNGEIFNYQELRSELAKHNYVFRTTSDTEVLLYSFIHYRENCLDKLNGMFAFAIWDNNEKTLFVARDRVGVKPLYYYLDKDRFVFASEPKAIFKSGIKPIINTESLDELLLFRYVAGEQTVFKNVYRLLPGHAGWLKQGRFYYYRWWNLPEKIRANREIPVKDPFTTFEDIFYSAVKYRTISDVPVGLMLSGGLDSGSVAAALHYNGEKDISGFTFSFHDPLYDEALLAKQVCLRFGLKFNVMSASSEQIVQALKDAAWFYDEPLVHQNDVPMLILAKYAKRKVTVLLSGEGADELMGGYVRYKPLNNYRLLPIGSMVANLLKFIPSSGIVNRYDKLSRYLRNDAISSLVLLNSSNIYPSDLSSIGIKIDLDKFEYRKKIYKEALELYPVEPARQAMYMDLFIHLASILDRNDRMTMGAGIECRVPFLDYRLLEWIPSLPTKLLLRGKKGKNLLFKTMGKYLPEEVRKFRKLGFSVPWKHYINKNDELSYILQNIAKGSLSDLYPQLNNLGCSKIVSLSTEFNETLLRQLLMVEIWKNEYLNKF
jgi:asparagine synthase (glutamine-hydrolysing)